MRQMAVFFLIGEAKLKTMCHITTKALVVGEYYTISLVPAF